ncbi:MAG: HPr family phosphocarrier protein [candidate division Zixibacteria bacterium]|nr:HPr family phosphocarrier protein [candidate division Zixibacteria bacterium]
MIKKTATIVNKLGLHARPAAQLVSTATKFEAEVFYSKGDLRVNGKSIMGVMMLAAEQGSQLVIEVEGPDEGAAMEALLMVIASGFSEGVDE